MGDSDDQVPSVLKISTLAVGPLASEPPLTKMRPSCNRTEQPPSCSEDILFAEPQLPVATCGNEALRRKLSVNTPIAKRMYRFTRRICLHSGRARFFKGSYWGRNKGPFALNSRSRAAAGTPAALT